MLLNKQTPGVYVEEVDGGARPITTPSTSVLAMIGFCREAVEVDDPTTGQRVTRPVPNTPQLVTSWTQFCQKYGDLSQAYPGGYLHQAMLGYFLNGGASAYVVGLPMPVKVTEEPQVPLLPPGEAYLPNAAGQRTLRIATTQPFKAEDQITVEVQPPGEGAPEGSFNLAIYRMGVEPKIIPNLTLGRGRGQRNVADVLLKESENLVTAEILEAPGTPIERMPAVGSKLTLTPAPVAAKPAVAPAPLPKVSLDVFKGDAAKRTGIAGLEAVDEVTLVACPDIMALHEYGLVTDEEVKVVQQAMYNHCEAMKDRFAILDCPRGKTVQEMIEWRKTKMNFDSKYAALYYPWIKVNGQFVPPSGHIAGVYARVDAERGVHKAPANEILRGAIDLEINVSHNEQSHLNPIGVNCIRSFPGRGIRVWGARTLSSDPQWTYINVRRLFCNIEEAILQGTQWTVFEPNDPILWAGIRREVSAYLTIRWREGALFGNTPEEAFFVKCDAELNTPEVRDRGYCLIQVGIAPVKPAEFVVFYISQKRDGAGSASE